MISSTFPLGQVVATRGLMDSVPVPIQLAALERHANGDWGVLCEEDRKANDNAIKSGDRILSSYSYSDIKFWIITEWDRSVTTLFLPDEY